ncbi:hypothetical protein [Kitasatospora sp. MAA19]|uniref:hypothetical protein n=1 Tax=Kitasatospora sp. MAA19 TaxID=3035090 RepID=UPI00247577C2|nr:hypothetical protein [Kitasatospora sp. MAA19]
MLTPTAKACAARSATAAPPGHERTAAWTSYVGQGAGAWRLYWTWGPADTDRGGQDGAVLTVLLIGPHL